MKSSLFAIMSFFGLVFSSAGVQAQPKVLYVGDSIAWETADVVSWWAQSYAGASTSRLMWGGLAICDFTQSRDGGESQLTKQVKLEKPSIVVFQFVGNALTPCMHNLGGEAEYFAKYYREAELATKQIADAAKASGFPRPKIMWVLQGPSRDSSNNARLSQQYREIAEKNGDLVSDAGYEVSAAAFPGADYAAKRDTFTYFVPCSDFEKSIGYCTNPEDNLARVHQDIDPTHYCLGQVEGWSCSLNSPGLLRYGMRIAKDIADALK